MYVFREALEEDFEAICHLVKTQDELFLIYPSGKYPLTVSQMQDIAKNRTDLTVVASDRAVIGFANFYDYKPGLSAFIGNVIIDQSLRGQGLGKALISHMLNVGYEKHNLPELRISVFNTNTPALLLYARAGFVPYDLEERTNPHGQRVVTLHMRMERDRYQAKGI